MTDDEEAIIYGISNPLDNWEGLQTIDGRIISNSFKLAKIMNKKEIRSYRKLPFL